MFLAHFNLTDDFCQINPSTLEHVALSNTLTFEYHAELAFATPATVDVTVHFPLHFHLLRLLYYADFKYNVPSPTRDFAQTVACVAEAKTCGGKSKSRFFRSFDGRFIIKEIEEIELRAFLESGGRAYIFAGRAVTSTYDLKGTVKKRTLGTNEMNVGLDGNFVRALTKHPIVLRPLEKARLMEVLQNDTEMLARANVMDYSLVVGCNEARAQVWVGFIDYIRTYTFDKKIENWVKKLSNLGEDPTVIKPDFYRKRLITFVDSVFMVMPGDEPGPVHSL